MILNCPMEPSVLKDLGTFSNFPQIYIKLTVFENNDSGKLPLKYYLLRFCSFLKNE